MCDLTYLKNNLFFEQHPQPMFIFCLKKLDLLAVNAAALELYGYTRTDFLNRKVTDLIPPEHMAAFLTLIQTPNLPRREKVLTRHKTAEGKPVDVEVSAQSIPWKKEKARWVCLRDVTNDQQQAISLTRSYALYEDLVSGLPHGVFRLRTAQSGVWHMEYVSQRWTAITGIEAQEVHEDLQSFFRIFGESAIQTIYQAFWEALETRERFVWEGQHQNTGQFFRIEAIPQKQNNGDMLWLGLLSDVTTEHVLQARLNRQNQELSRLSQHLPGILFRLEYDFARQRFSLPYCSEQIRAFFALSPEAIAENIEVLRERMYAEDIDGLLATFLRSLQDFSVVSHRFRNRAGSAWFQVDARPDQRSEKKVVWYGFLKDITRYHHTEIQLERTNAQLQQALALAEQASEAKGQFLAHMSHEIRTPMNGVVGMLELLQDTPLSEKQQSYLRVMRQSSSSLMAIIGNILDFSKIEAGKLILEKRPIQLPLVIEQVFALIQGKAREKNIQTRLEMESGLPETLIGDTVRLQQVLLNLLSNAVKFTDSGSVSLRVNASDRSEQSVSLRFTVEDTGIGISQEESERLFSPFEQADGSITRKYGGTGLGLTITRELVNLMQGSITAVPLDRGTRFEAILPFQLPRGKGSQKHVHNSYSAIQDAAACRILLAEDNPINQLVVESLLRKLEHDCDTVENGQEALDAVRTTHYDLIIMDCQMPVMDGYMSTEKLRKNGFEAPIIALTANALATDRQKCLDAGMNDYLSKPFTADTFNACLTRWLPTQGEQCEENSEAFSPLNNS